LHLFVVVSLASQAVAESRGVAAPDCPLLFAHRGDTRVYPANTIKAFEAAFDQGFDGIELDVQFSSDRVAIVSHDDNLAVATTCRGKISETAAEELRKCMVVRTTLLPESRLIARSTLHPQHLPRLDEALVLLLRDPSKSVVVDIKPLVHPQGTVAALRAACTIHCATLQQRITFISQNQYDADLLKPAFPHAHIALESNRTVSGLIDEICPDRCPKHWDDTKIDTYSISFNSLFDPKLKFVKLLRGENMTPRQRFDDFYKQNSGLAQPRRMLGWTVSSRAGIQGLQSYKFDRVLTDLTKERFWELWRESAPALAPVCG